MSLTVLMFLNKRWVTDSASVKIERVTAYDGDIEIEADMDVELIEAELIEAELIEAEVERNL